MELSLGNFFEEEINNYVLCKSLVWTIVLPFPWCLEVESAMCKIYGGIPPNNKPCTTYGITLVNIKDSVMSEAGITQAEVFISIKM